MSKILITPIEDKCFGAAVTNVKLPELDAQGFSEIYAAFLRYGFLVFPDQYLTDQQNIDFGKRLGTLEFGALPIANQEKLEDGSYGKVLPVTTHRMRTNIGNEAWHTDSTYMPISSKCGMLSAVTVPAMGGETELADMRAAYADLDEPMRDYIEDLCAYHSTEFSQANDVGHFPERRQQTIYHGEAYLRPLVKTHPETGEKNLFIGRHAFGIPGLERDESRELLAKLLAFTVDDERRVYKHQWQKGDTLIWDNRALLHRACAYDYSQPRVMTATRVAGDPNSELAYYPHDPAAEAGRQALQEELAILRAAQ